MNTNYPPLPILLGEENLQDWRLKVIAAFAVNGMADYLFNTLATTPEKMALGMNILVPSLAKQRVYLTKAGWDFNTKNQQEPRGLYNLVLKSIPQRETSIQIHDILYRLLRVEKGDNPVAKYVERIQSMRESLQKLGYIVDEHLLVTVTLHGLRDKPFLKQWGDTVVRDELAPGSLTFDKLVKVMVEAAAAEHKTNNTNTTKNVQQVKGPVKVPPSCGRSASSGPSSQASNANITTNHTRPAQNQFTQGANGKAKVSPDTVSTSAKPVPDISFTKANPVQARPMNPKFTGPTKVNPTQTRPTQAKPDPSKMPGAFIETEEEHDSKNTTNKESEIEQLRRELGKLVTEQDTKEFLAKNPNFWRRLGA